MFNEQVLISELQFKAVRSSGAGGQHVNKVSSKVVLSFDLVNSQVFTVEQKELLFKNLANRLTLEGVLVLYSDENRSQHRNKIIVTDKFINLIIENLKIPKDRKETKVPKSVKLKRLSTKRKHSEKKANRKPPMLE